MIPSSPNIVMPPSSARNTSPVCISTLPRIASGLTTLSARVSSTPHQTAMKTAAVMWPVNASNTAAGIQMMAVPTTGTNEATSVTIPRKTAWGTRASVNPMVASTACTTAVSAAPTSVALETLANSCSSSSVWAACKGETRPSKRMRCRPSTRRK